MSPSKLQFVSILSLLLVLPAAALAAELKAGESFPSLADKQMEGAVPELAGKIVLVDFWASWCAPCRASFPAFNALHERYAARGVVILAVNLDEKKADMEKFLRATPAKFGVVRDAKQKLVVAASVTTMPTSFILGRDGKVRYIHHGFKGAETVKKLQEELDALLANP